MGSSSELAEKLDFNIGLEFQDAIRHRFHSPVHHPFPTPDDSFFLLATFRRFLFRLTESSVALALESCLGGRASDFHVKFVSNNHFRFSVFSKDVGFQIYKLRRVIASQFDIYFHLWSNGTPHWEREKRAWEIEQQKEWTKVLSKSAKREAKKKEKEKHVRFAANIVQSPPKSSFQPKRISLRFGSFTMEVDPVSGLVCSPSPAKPPPVAEPEPTRFRRDPKNDHATVDGHAPVKPPNAGARSEKAANPISNLLGRDFSCSRCLGLGHSRQTCKFRIRCYRCLNFGHVKASCRKPIWQWLPKALKTKCEPAIIWRPKVHTREPHEGDTDESKEIGKISEDCASCLDSRVGPSHPTLMRAQGPNISVNQHCATIISRVRRRDTPNSLKQKNSELGNNSPFRPIIINRLIFQNQQAPPAVTGLEIVPWQPPHSHAIALEYWPIIIEARHRAGHKVSPQPQVNQNSEIEIAIQPENAYQSEVIQNSENENTIQSDGAGQSDGLSLISVVNSGSQGSSLSSPAAFEFQSTQIQPSPISVRGRKQKAVRASNVVSLPLRIADPASPLVESSVRRCTRNKRTDGFREVRLSKEPNKKQKICVIEIDEKTGKTGPISLPVLQSWGLGCGVAPGELS